MVDSVATSQAKQIQNEIEKIVDHSKRQVKTFQSYAKAFEVYCALNREAIEEQDPEMIPGVPGHDIWKLLATIHHYRCLSQAACAQLNQYTRDLKTPELRVYPDSDLSTTYLQSLLEADLS